MIGFVFDSYDMQADGCYVVDSDIFSAPPRSIDTVKLANSDGAVIVKTTYEARTAKIEGYLQADTSAELRTLIDTFNRNMNKQDVYLDITEEDDTVRRYLVTTQNIVMSRPRGLNVANYSVEILIPSGVGQDVTEQSLGSTTITNSSGELSISIDGSYKGEPYITVTVTSVTGGTSTTLSVNNTATLRGITITRTWTAGDIVEIDCQTKTVYVNGAETEYTGQVPSWNAGSGTIGYVDAFTTRSVSISATYTPRYL